MSSFVLLCNPAALKSTHFFQIFLPFKKVLQPDGLKIGTVRRMVVFAAH